MKNSPQTSLSPFPFTPAKIEQFGDYFSLYRMNPHFLINPTELGWSQNPEVTQTHHHPHLRYQYQGVPIRTLTEYQPIYPTSYFSYWELCYDHSLVTGQQTRVIQILENLSQDQGGLEAIHNFCEAETLNHQCELIQYTQASSASRSRDPRTRRLQQTFQPRVISSSSELEGTGHLVIVEVSNLTAQSWGVELVAFEGHQLLRLPSLHQLDLSLFQEWATQFEEVSLQRPHVQHPLQEAIYLLGKYRRTIPREKIPEWESLLARHQKLIFRQYQQYFKLLQLSQHQQQRELNQPDLEPKWDRLRHSTLLVGSGLTWCQQYHVPFRSYYCQKPIPTFLRPKPFSGFLTPQSLIPLDPARPESYVPSLSQIKARLNRIRRVLDSQEQKVKMDLDLDVVDWTEFTHSVDLYRNLKKTLVWKCQSEVTTSSWLKMQEIMKRLSCDHSAPLKTLHLSESLGGMISGLNHYRQSSGEKLGSWEWLAHSLNPHQPQNQGQVSTRDDYGLRTQQGDRWLYGADDTGDLTHPENILFFSRHPELEGVNLITADGGITLQKHMWNQEEKYTGLLVYAQFLTILLTLPKGQSAVWKAFLPLAEASTLSWLYLTTCWFEQVELFKPATSHPNNGEVYVIAQGYRGKEEITPEIMRCLLEPLEDFSITQGFFSWEQLPVSFRQEIQEISTQLCQQQIESLQHHLALRSIYYQDYDLQFRISKERTCQMNNWLYQQQLQPLPQEARLVDADRHRKEKHRHRYRRTHRSEKPARRIRFR